MRIKGVIKIKLHEKIRIHIIFNGIKIKSVADKANIKSSKLYRLLDGSTKMSAEDYESICKALSLEPEYFFKQKFALNENREQWQSTCTSG